MNDESAFLPIDGIIVNGMYIDGSMITQDIYHDLGEATLSVTFCNVKTLHVDYKHNRENQ